MFSPYEMLIAGLALWRVSSLLTSEKGPLYIFVWIRERFGVIHDENKDVIDTNGSKWAYLFTCPWCMSMLLAILYVPLLYFFKDITLWCSIPFTISALAIIADSLIKR